MILRFVGAVNFRGALLEENSFSKGLLIAQQLLLSTCYIMPAFTLSHLTVFHELRGTGWTTHAKHHVVHVLDVVLVAAAALGTVSASEYSKGLTASDTADTVQTFREASSITTAAILVLLTVYNAVLTMRPRLPRSTSLWLCLTSLCLVIPFAYRLYRSFNPSSSDISTSSATKIEFYALEMGVEYIVVLSLLAVNAKEWCGVLNEDELPEGVYGMYDGSKTKSEGSLLLQPRTT
ncbi:uncharacterized protein STEHIDRAFT_146025 [Stereum hirsutum FP-91666 SS1]|uniref:uncharacterized protein n=1 Tax=Stereum hirsutum (strain FP-91666) TaxID=721885 RepID=UPI000440FDE6|nr:uncharacterized protein STEHIDRAFT_146025 [Stereum hirsutum FP-91666 SS1]EIM87812.1 hypothetical protein STEHIDRAFT_146025 [Stereum hirsutum FP-91666 SS1]